MAFDIITVLPTTVDGAHAAGDVMFNLTEFSMPARACKLINIFMEVANGGGEDDTKIGILFFKKNTTASLGTAGPSSGSGTGATIAHADFRANEHIGQTVLGLSDGSNLDLDVIDTTALYYSAHQFSTAAASRSGAGLMEMVLTSDATKTSGGVPKTVVYMAGVVHSGAPDFDATDNVKIHLHIEY